MDSFIEIHYDKRLKTLYSYEYLMKIKKTIFKLIKLKLLEEEMK